MFLKSKWNSVCPEEMHFKSVLKNMDKKVIT